MKVYDFIFHKRNGGEHSPDELREFVRGVTADEFPREQVGAWLMAAFLQGLSSRETAALTEAMTGSGERLDLSAIAGEKVDKHSTGGVGDGTSLVLAPLLAAAGAVVPMMSGRALGHTGGTLDKLEAIPGFRVDLSVDEFKRQLKSLGCAMIGQTAQVAPADKRLYAIRDVTATVDSIPLIAASIMSKKLAEGADALVLDVKTGSGAFMRDRARARALARAMVGIGKGAGVKTVALVTDMDSPLGGAAGNSLEVMQAVEILKGRGPADFRDLTLTLGAWMLVLAGKATRPAPARRTLERLLSDGSALAKFRDLVGAQGGNPGVTDRPELLAAAPVRGEVLSRADGFVTAMDTREIGLIVSALGAGRSRPSDAVDHGVGIVFRKKTGDRVAKGEPLAAVQARSERELREAQSRYVAAVRIGRQRPRRRALVQEVIR